MFAALEITLFVWSFTLQWMASGKAIPMGEENYIEYSYQRPGLPFGSFIDDFINAVRD
jgi:hypothetical protein